MQIDHVFLWEIAVGREMQDPCAWGMRVAKLCYHRMKLASESNLVKVRNVVRTLQHFLFSLH